MINQNKLNKYINYISVFITLLVAGIGVPAILRDAPSMPVIIALLSLIGIYTMALIANEETDELQWTGYARLPLIVAWMLSGISVATLVAIAGGLLAYLYVKQRKLGDNSYTPPQAFLTNFTNSYLSLFTLHLLYLMMDGNYPPLTGDGMYHSPDAISLALAGSSLISLMLVAITQELSIRELMQDAHKYFPPEVLVILASFVLPVIFIQVNLIVFLVTLGFIAMHIYRQAQVKQSEMAMKKHIQEITTLNTLGTMMASSLSIVSTLEAVHSELNELLDATTIYLALYDEDHNTLDYRLFVVNGEHIKRDKQKPDGNLEEFIIQEQKCVFHTREELHQQFNKLYDVSDLSDMQYMIAPLRVSTKLSGILGVSHKSNPRAFSESDFSLFQTIAGQTSLAIRNAILYDRTVRLADNLSIINQSLQDIMFNPNHVEAMRTSCEIALNITGASKVAIFLLTPESDNHMTLMQSIGFEDVEFVDSLPYRPSHYKDGLRIITDIEDAAGEEYLKELAKKVGFKACVEIPLRSGNTIVGTLNVYHDNPHFYEATSLNLLEMLTNQITAALDNADLLNALELYAAEQAQLVHLSRISGGTLELDRVILDVCQILTRMMHVSRVAIGIWLPDKGTLLVESPDSAFFDLQSSEINVQDIPEFAGLLREDGLASLQVFHADNDSHSSGLVQYMKKHHDMTLGILPMRLNEKAIGLIVLGDINKYKFSDNDFRLLEMANHQITVQVHNAQVHERTEIQLANRLEQLGLIEDIARQISEALELNIIIQNVLEASLQASQANFAAIALVDKQDSQLFDVIWREVIDDRLVPNRITLEMTSGIVGKVMKSSEIVIVPDNSALEHYVPPRGAVNTFRSSLAVPMRTGNKTVGVLNLESIRPDFFTMEQASFIQSLAGHAAISIDNANLLVERERQINELTLLRELSLDALSVIEAEDIFQAVLRTALILLDSDETTLYAYDDLEQRITLLGSIRTEDGTLQNASPVIPEAIVHDTIKRGQLQLIPDVMAHDIYQSYDRLVDVRHRSLIIIPVTQRRQLREVLCIGFDESRKFTYDDLNIVDLLSIQIAGHLENAALNEEITTSNDRMRAILDSTRDGIILLDNEEKIQDANSAASKLTGIDLQAYLFKPLSDIGYLHLHPEHAAWVWDDIIAIYQKSPEELHNREFMFQHDDDQRIQVKMLVTDVIDETSETVGRLLILRDITEEKELQDFRETMQSMVLHDLRGPLSSIVTSMYVAENILLLDEGNDFKELQTSLGKTFKAALTSAEDMLRQVDTLRDLPMMNQMEVRPQPIPMVEIADSAFNSLSANFLDSEIVVELDIPHDYEVFVDDSLIQRVLVNLMHNAFKFTPKKGKVMIRLVARANKENYVTIQVADTGPGIPVNQRERIFRQFVQIEDQKPRAGGKGTGLGLNFCKLAVEAHGGQIWVDTESPLSGACFSFTVPEIDWRNQSQNIIS